MSLGKLQHLLRDDRVVCSAAVVRLPPDNASYYDVIAGQLLVYCVGKVTQQPFWAHCCGTRLGRGMWEIPDVGTEVLIGFDDGESEGDAFIVGTFGRSTPSDLDDETTILVDTSVKVRGTTLVTLGADSHLEQVGTETDLSNLAGLLQDSTVITALATLIADVISGVPASPAPENTFIAAVAAYFEHNPVPGTARVKAERA